MRIPVFEECEVETYELTTLIAHLKKRKAGKVPLYFSLDPLSPKEAQVALDNIAVALKSLDIHPYFPYPTYVIYKGILQTSLVPCVPNVQSLPQNFMRKSKRLKNKELNLLNKTSMIAEKIFNSDLYSKMEDLKKIQRGQKELFLLTKESQFYEEILQKIHQQMKENL